MARKRTPNEAAMFLDKIKRLAIAGLFSDRLLLDKLVLKGGNLLDLVYGISSRSSIDIDVSLDGDFEEEPELLRRRIERALDSVFSDAALQVFDVNLKDVPPEITDDMKPFWGGYKVDFKVIEVERFHELKGDVENMRRSCLSVGKRGSTKFKIDISKHEYCSSKQQAEIDGFTIFTYTPAMFVSEKIRAICQQMASYSSVVGSHPSARSRDFLDVYLVVTAYQIYPESVDFQSLLRSTFGAKRVPVSLVKEIRNTFDFHVGDFVSVLQTIKPDHPVRDFQFYFNFVVDFCSRLPSLWNE